MDKLVSRLAAYCHVTEHAFYANEIKSGLARCPYCDAYGHVQDEPAYNPLAPQWHPVLAAPAVVTADDMLLALDSFPTRPRLQALDDAMLDQLHHHGRAFVNAIRREQRARTKGDEQAKEHGA